MARHVASAGHSHRFQSESGHLRIAFLTPEYPSEMPHGGGLGNYLRRMARLLIEMGHEPEIFVLSHQPSGFATSEGVPLHRVNGFTDQRVLRLVACAGSKLMNSGLWRDLGPLIWPARELSDALERRHEAAPFQLVQSADYMAPGLFVRRKRGRIHVVRCSHAADLYYAAGFRAKLERLMMKRAMVAYAPSRFIADHFMRSHKMQIPVIRPPTYLECRPSPNLSFPLPDRYFLHFGQLMERKGTALLAQALPIAWDIAPDLTMVWSGHCWDAREMECWRSLWGERASQVQITGPLNKPDLYAVLQRAEISVLPSQIDNCPNTLIESLMMGIPVVGSSGASIDELVEEGRTGHLVPLGDARVLGQTLARLWRTNSPVRRGFIWESAVAKEMEPRFAASRLLELANHPGHSILAPHSDRCRQMPLQEPTIRSADKIGLGAC
jgi:glycosyltransferase involved in cell wall biosynthesis